MGNANPTRTRVLHMLYGADPFVLRAESPAAWLLNGLGLLRACYPVWMAFRDRRCWNWKKKGIFKPGEGLTRWDKFRFVTDRYAQAYMLLAGLAAENLLKGLFVAQYAVKSSGENWIVASQTMTS